MSHAENYAMALTQARQHSAEPELLPAVLVTVCVELLGVDGAGLSITENLRLPLAASNADVATAERLQTTLGQGPCLTAAGQAALLIAGPDDMAEKWPMFHRELMAQTPFRSVLSLPLGLPTGEAFGALDLYSTQPDPSHFDALAYDGTIVAGKVSNTLLAGPSYVDGPGVSGYQWLSTDSVNERMKVWMAIGTLVAQAEIPSRDAVDLLRAYAFAHGTTLDDVAAQVVTNRLDPHTLV